MPIYSYRCPRCGKESEEFSHCVSASREVVIVCTGCGNLLNRIMTPVKYKIKAGDFFEPYLEEDITGEPIKITSQDHFFRECEKAGKGFRKGPEKLL